MREDFQGKASHSKLLKPPMQQIESLVHVKASMQR